MIIPSQNKHYPIRVRPSTVVPGPGVDKDALYEATVSHRHDVLNGLEFFRDLLCDSANLHDADKLHDEDAFHGYIESNFKDTWWWERHKRLTRHHLNDPEGVPLDVTLIDVLEMITDCTMAGMARSGKVFPLTINPDVLMKAFQNTAELLQKFVVVDTREDADECG